MFLGSRSTTEIHGHSTATNLISGHTSEGKLGNTDEPGETVRVTDKGWKGKANQGKGTPKSDLSVDLLPVWLDNETFRPGRGIPFLLFAFLFLGKGVFQIVSVLKRFFQWFALNEYRDHDQ